MVLINEYNLFCSGENILLSAFMDKSLFFVTTKYVRYIRCGTVGGEGGSRWRGAVVAFQDHHHQSLFKHGVKHQAKYN